MMNNLKEATPKAKGTFVIQDLETLKVISDPLRLQILERMVLEPKTVKQIADELEIEPNKLYYHINLLEKHGLIAVVGTKLVSGIVEKHYRVTAEDITVAEGLISLSEPEGEDTVRSLMTTVLDSTREEFLRMLKQLSAEKDPKQKKTSMIAKEMARMTDEQAKEFSRRLSDLISEFKSSDAQGKDVQAYALMATLYPTSRLGGRTEDE